MTHIASPLSDQMYNKFFSDIAGVIRFQVTPQEVEIVYKQPITVRCELETSLHLHFMWLVEDNIFHSVSNNSYVTVINTVTHGKHIMEAKYREFQRHGVEVIGCYIQVGDVYLKREIPVKCRCTGLWLVYKPVYPGVPFC